MNHEAAPAKRGFLERHFLAGYKRADFFVQAKATYTVYLAIVLLAADLAPFALMLVKGFSIGEASFRLVALAAILTAVALLRAGKYRASSGFLVSVTIVVLWVFMYMRPFQHYYELYALAFLLEAAVLMACLIGHRRALPAVAAALSYAAILALYFARTRAMSPAEDHPKELESLFFIAIFLGLSGFVGNSLMRLVDKFTSIARSEMEMNRNRIEALGSVVASVREGMAVGDRLLGFVRDNDARVRSSRGSLSALREGFGRFSERMGVASDGNAEIAGFVGRVRDQTLRHSEAIHETSASIEQINATIDALSSGTKDKRSRLEELQALTERGASDMDQALDAILKIASSSQTITEVGKIIQKISSQTNLLAMNASIEAAHAGDYGRGFAVVADEIRALAAQTSANAKEITSTLKEISLEIDHARGVNQTASSGFRATSSEVASVSDAMDGLFNAFGEIGGGIVEITAAVTGVRDASLEIEAAIKSISARSTAGASELSALGASLDGYAKDIDAVLASFDHMKAGMEELEAIGKENLERIAAVESAVARMDRASAMGIPLDDRLSPEMAGKFGPEYSRM